MAKGKIVLDADVIISFSCVSILSQLADIFPGYDFIVLDKVYNEILGDTRKELDNNIHYLGKILIEPFPNELGMKKEYATLIKNFGKGESACMAYCRYTGDVVGSSNFKDVKDYCTKNNIVYLGAVDFLYYAVKHEIMTNIEATENLKNMITKGCRLPSDIDFTTYQPTSIL